MLKRLIALILFLSVLAVRPAFAAPPIEDYGKLPGVEMVALSASGNRYAVVGVVAGSRQLLVLEPGNKLVLNVGLSDEKVRDLDWVGDDYVLITSTRTYNLKLEFGTNYEIAHVGILNVNTKKLVFAMNSGDAQNGVWGQYGVHQKDGKWWAWFGGMTMASGQLRSGHPDLYRVDLESGRPSFVATGGEDRISRSWLVESGEIAARSEYLEGGYWRMTVGDKRVVDLRDPLHEAGIFGLGRTPGTILYQVPAQGGPTVYELKAGAEGPGEELFADRKKGSYNLLYDPWTYLFVGTARDGERPVYEFFEPRLQARARAIDRAFPGYRARIESWSKDFGKAVVFTDGKDDSGTYWVIDFSTGKADRVGLAYPSIKPADVAEAKLIRYKAADGLEIEAVLTLPVGREARHLPVVVMPHGGPRARDYAGFDWLAQAIAARGYAVLQPNFRGSAGYGLEFLDAGKGEFGRKMQTDLSDGLKHIAGQGLVDPKRACILGASYGGYAALAGVTLQQGVYRCSVSYAGIGDLQDMVRHDAQFGSQAERRYWRELIGPETVMREVSPIRYVDKADAPVLLIHGKDDTVVPFKQSRDMEGALRRARKPVELVALDGEDHWLSRGATRTAMLKAAVEFLEKHNPPQ